MSYETVTGYCWPQSVAPGQSVALHLSSAGDRPVGVEIVRVGAGRTSMWHGEVPTEFHDLPADAATNGCNWPAATTIPVGEDWESGYYEVTLTIDVNGRTRRDHAFFVVRPAERSTNRILLQLATNTWHAYNDVGGTNLYLGATQSSLLRPMTRGLLEKPPGAGRRVVSTSDPDPDMAAYNGYLLMNRLSFWVGFAGWPNWELPFLAWAEKEGYGIDVVSNADLEEHPEIVGRYDLLLSVGHDEYWSAPMRDTVEDYIAGGGNVAFLSGNTAFWQVRLEDRDENGPATTMVGYKAQLKKDPVYGTERQAELTSMWSDHLVERPENHMTGVSFSRGGYHRIGKRVTNGAGGYTVHRADHWLFDHTGIGYGDVLGADATVVGYECDGCDFTYVDGLPHPTDSDGTPTDFTILATAPAAHFTRTTSMAGVPTDQPSELEFIASRLFGERDDESTARIANGHAVFGTYTSPGGGTVVTSGSTEWAHGLAEHDPQIEQITRNLLDRLGASAD